MNSLRYLREKKELTTAQLAGKTSISLRTLSAYEAGEKALVGDDLKKLARALNVGPSDMLAAPPAGWSPLDTVARPAPLPQIPPPVLPRPRPEPVTVAVEAPTVNAPIVVNAMALTEQRPRPPVAVSDVPRPPRPSRPPTRERRPSTPHPATAGQLDQLRQIAMRLGISDGALVERIGQPLQQLTLISARQTIGQLQKELEESGTWQPRAGEGPDQEGEFLVQLRDRGAMLDVTLINGDRFRGTVRDVTPYVIYLADEATGDEIALRKFAIAYYRTKDGHRDTR